MLKRKQKSLDSEKEKSESEKRKKKSSMPTKSYFGWLFEANLCSSKIINPTYRTLITFCFSKQLFLHYKGGNGKHRTWSFRC